MNKKKPVANQKKLFVVRFAPESGEKFFSTVLQYSQSVSYHWYLKWNSKFENSIDKAKNILYNDLK